MLIRVAPEKLSNTKLSTSDKIIKEFKKDNSCPIEIAPQSIYRKLATHDIFTEFAKSNQVLCKQLRPFFLTKDQEPKPFNKAQLKSKTDSLQGDGKLFYKSPTENNLLEYLANALIYKAFLMDAKEQMQKKMGGDYNKKSVEEKNELKKQANKLDKCKEDVDQKEKERDEIKNEIKKIREPENCKNRYERCKVNFDEECKNKYENWKQKLARCEQECSDIEFSIGELQEDISKLNKETEEYKNKEKGLNEEKAELKSVETKRDNVKKEFSKYEKIKEDYDESKANYEKIEKLDTCNKNYQESNKEYRTALEEYKKLVGHEFYEFLREYQKLDYKVSVHIRFARTMNALNAYTDENFKAAFQSKYGRPYQETGISDEYGWRDLKRRNIMKLERGEINRYVTVQNGGIYTSIVDRSQNPQEHGKHERIKFSYIQKGGLPDSNSTPIWSFVNNDTIEERIRKSCDNFNKKIEDHVISTYAHYYCADNILKEKGAGSNTKLYLNYVHDPAENKLEIPCFIDDEKIEEEAPLHVMLKPRNEGKTYNPTINKKFSYKLITCKNRPSIYDIFGYLYAIRKNQIAVSPMNNGFHSSMWSGKKVQAAGVLAAWNGKLIAVDNQSGHYRPNWYLTYMAWKPFYDKGVFHKDAIIGILTPTKLGVQGVAHVPDIRNVCQFFNVKEFMDLAKTGLEIGATVKELNNHIKKLEGIRKPNGKGFESTDQSNSDECQDVLTAPHLYCYNSVWSNGDFVNKTAWTFIESMNYKWDTIRPGFENAYKLFRGKKILLWRIKKIESVFKNRAKKLKAAIKEIKNPAKLQKREEEKYDALTTAKNRYKKIFSKIKIKPKPTNEEKFELVGAAADIYYANDAYSELVKEVLANRSNEEIRKCQDKIDAWVKQIEPPLKTKADKRVGLDIEEWETYLPGPLLSNEGENYPGKKNEDHLGNGVDVLSEVEPSAEAKRVLLVDKRSYEPQQAKTPPTKSETSKTSQPPTQPTAQPMQKTKKPQSEGGKRFRCIECGKEVIIYSYDTSRCPKCGKMGCLDRI